MKNFKILLLEVLECNYIKKKETLVKFPNEERSIYIYTINQTSKHISVAGTYRSDKSIRDREVLSSKVVGAW